MARQDAERAGLVLGAKMCDVVGFDDDGKRRGDGEPHVASFAACASLLPRLLEIADHVERAFGPVIGLAVQNRAASGERGLELDRRGRILPVNATVTMKGWVRKRMRRRARLTALRSAALSSSMPSSAMISWSSR